MKKNALEFCLIKAQNFKNSISRVRRVRLLNCIEVTHAESISSFWMAVCHQNNQESDLRTEAFDCQTSGERRGPETEINPVVKDSIKHAC